MLNIDVRRGVLRVAVWMEWMEVCSFAPRERSQICPGSLGLLKNIWASEYFRRFKWYVYYGDYEVTAQSSIKCDFISLELSPLISPIQMFICIFFLKYWYFQLFKWDWRERLRSRPGGHWPSTPESKRLEKGNEREGVQHLLNY